MPVLIFVFGTVLLYLLEPYLKAQDVPSYRARHAKTNLKISFLNIAVLAGSGLIVSSIALWTAASGFGARYYATNYLPNAVIFCFNILAYDFVNYWIHRSQHQMTKLWPLHRVHHTDPYLDVTSAFRFHPFESIYRVLVQAVAVCLMGMTLAEVSAYLVIVVSALLFSHSNIKLIRPLDRFLGYIVVTPDIHRIHHAWQRHLHDSNYGIVFTCWDRLLGTFSNPDKAATFTIGLEEYPHASDMNLGDILADPFAGKLKKKLN